jgi:hypothetical protein
MSIDEAVAATAKGKLPAPEKDKEMDPSELWLALTAIPRPHREVPFPRNIPGTDQTIGMIAMWPLSQEEQHASNAAADKFVRELFKDPQRKEDANLGYHNAFTNELAIQVLHRACRDVTDIKRPAFPSTKKMRANFSTDELGVLFSTYCTVQSELGPIRAYMSKQEEEALIIRLAEGGSAFPLASISSGARESLVLSMASRLVNSWTLTSSLGGQPDVSTFALELLCELCAAKKPVHDDADGVNADSDSEGD